MLYRIRSGRTVRTNITASKHFQSKTEKFGTHFVIRVPRRDEIFLTNKPVNSPRPIFPRRGRDVHGFTMTHVRRYTRLTLCATRVHSPLILSPISTSELSNGRPRAALLLDVRHRASRRRGHPGAALSSGYYIYIFFSFAFLRFPPPRVSSPLAHSSQPSP